MKVAVVFPFRAGCPHRETAYRAASTWWATAVPEWEQITADDEGDVFSRGGSLNVGISESDADVIVAADADLLISRTQILEAVELAGSAPGLVQPFTRLHWYAEAATAVLLEHPHAAFYPPTPPATYRWDVDESTPLLGGMNVLSRESWERAGGWPTSFRGWGHEDLVFAAQCRTLVAPHRKVAGTVHHLYHPKPVTTDYASPETITRNTAEAERWLAADGDPAAMRELVRG